VTQGIYFDPWCSISTKGIYSFNETHAVFIEASYGVFFEKDSTGQMAQVMIGYRHSFDLMVPKKNVPPEL
jgi:hypothetical protein